MARATSSVSRSGRKHTRRRIPHSARATAQTRRRAHGTGRQARNGIPAHEHEQDAGQQADDTHTTGLAVRASGAGAASAGGTIHSPSPRGRRAGAQAYARAGVCGRGVDGAGLAARGAQPVVTGSAAAASSHASSLGEASAPSRCVCGRGGAEARGVEEWGPAARLQASQPGRGGRRAARRSSGGGGKHGAFRRAAGSCPPCSC